MRKLFLFISIISCFSFSAFPLSPSVQAANWTALNSTIDSNLYSVSCPSTSNCYALGTGIGGTISVTTDGGTSWKAQVHPGGALQSITCPTSLNCFVSGNAGFMIATTDGGLNWNVQNSATTADLYGVSCPTTTTCFAVGNDSSKNGVVIATTDGGTSWNIRFSTSNHEYFAISCPTSTSCYAVGVNGNILATNNGGTEWHTQNSGTNNTLSGISCPVENSCFVVGDKGTILRTANNGTTWFSQNSGSTSFLRNVYCNNSSSCTAVGSDASGQNGIVLSRGAGSSWKQVTTNSNGLFDVKCLESKCTVVGFNGTVLAGSQDFGNFVPEDASAFNDLGFSNTWARTDKPVSQIPGVGRGYTWGPLVGGALATSQEQYGNSTRTVQYFDKARMEVNNPNANPNDPYYVTTGLLVKELVTGNRQDGDNTFTPLEPSSVQIAGDPNDGNANSIAPTYASFRNVVTFFGNQNGLPNLKGETIVKHIDKAGNVTTITPKEQRFLTYYDNATDHNIADVFVNYGFQNGLIWDGAKYVQGGIFFPNFVNVLGRPVTDPYWVDAIVAGQQKQVLVQLFERRVLTYTPDNPDGFKVEVGNVGQHYYKWRYILNAH